MAACAAVVLGVALPGRAEAEELPEPQQDIWAPHIITDAKSPKNATINVFDYWLTTERTPDNNDPSGWESAGINQGHQLRFGKLGTHESYEKAHSINAWTGKSGSPHFGIVEPLLGEDGYPVMAAGNVYQTNPKLLTEREFLAYLFDTTVIPGKRMFTNAHGLVRQLDGYYTYDSQRNYASLDRDTKRFSLFKKPAVRSSSTNNMGQFTPFNGAEQVFEAPVPGGELTAKDKLKANDASINHYFGLELTADFSQPANGLVPGGDPMTFNFSGDDDVWVFIDGVLVGDLGGVHGAASLSIDFQTGAVRIEDGRENPKVSWGGKQTTLRACYEGALGKEAAEQYLKPGTNTFRDHSYHTLKFFYLERGNDDSNMRLTFNLQNFTQSSVKKDSQNSDPVEGAKFELLAAQKRPDGTYVPLSDTVVSSGTTNKNGSFTFMVPDGSRPLDFQELHGRGYDHFILRETEAPKGYRKAPEGWLRYVPSRGDGQDGFLVPDNMWSAAVYARPNQIVNVNDQGVVRPAEGHGNEAYTVSDDVTVFATLLKRDRAKGGWRAISGERGSWKVGDAKIDAAIDFNELFRSGAAHVFAEQNDVWTVDLGGLPGDPLDYRFMAAPDNDQIDYSIAYFLVKMSPRELRQQLDAGASPIGEDNIVWLDSTGKKGNFIRKSYATLHVTDVSDGFNIQKLDDAYTPINGVAFDLYRSDQMNAKGLTPRPGAVPVQSATTANMTKDPGVGLDGALRFEHLDAGTYYAVERAPKPGYEPAPYPVRIVVDQSGVYADAGVEDDGVQVSVGIGTLLDSMDQFGSNDDIEVTLHDVIATKQVAAMEPVPDAADGSYRMGAWGAATGAMVEKPLRLVYNDSTHHHDYKLNPLAEQAPQHGTRFVTDEGTIRAEVRQDPSPNAVAHGIGTWEDLGDTSLFNLFTGSTTVHVVNERKAGLEVEKRVDIPQGMTGPEGLDNLNFTFRFTFAKDGKPLDGAYTARVFAKNADGEEVQRGTDFELADGIRHSIKNGETIKIYGLPAGASYDVEEIKRLNPSGFAQTSPHDASGKPIHATGQIVQDAIEHRLFVNTYTPSAATLAASNITVEKRFEQLEGDGSVSGASAWETAPDASFAFVLQAYDANAPMPEGSVVGPSGRREKVVTIDASSKAQKYRANFGKITYAAPGTYLYLINERVPAPADRVPGVTYSAAAYRATVTVRDDGKGRLKAATALEKISGDAGEDIKPAEPVEPNRDGSLVAGWRNTLSRRSIAIGPKAIKTLDGRDMIVGPDGLGEFTFSMRPVGEHAATQPMPAGTEGEGAERVSYVHNSGPLVAFGQSVYTHDDLKHAPYCYEIAEVVPADAVNAEGVSYKDATDEQRAAGGFTFNGVTYDNASYVACVRLDSAGEHGELMTAVIDYYEGPWAGTIEGKQPIASSGADDAAGKVPFENVYHAQGAAPAVQLTKTMEGRPVEAGDFAFIVTPRDDASGNKLDTLRWSGGRVESPQGAAGERVVMGGSLALPMTQQDAGQTFSYLVREEQPAPGQGIPGVTYDLREYSVALTVQDNADSTVRVDMTVTLERDATGAPRHEKLDLATITDPATGHVSLDFVNEYRATGAFEGIEVAKTLNGRDMRDDEFTMHIKPLDAWSAKKMDERNLDAEAQKLEHEFGMAAATDGQPSVVSKLAGLSFNLSDVTAADPAQRVFSYEVWEEVLAESDDSDKPGIQLDGITFDRSHFIVRMTPVDDANGTMHVETRIERTSDALTGEALASPELVGEYDSRNAEVPRVPFVNVYETTPAPAQAEFFTKQLVGRDWQDGDSFFFEAEQVQYSGPAGDRLPGEDGFVAVPVPTMTVDSASPSEGDGTVRHFGFSGVMYAVPGVYSYRVREVVPSDDALPGIEYSKDIASFSVVVVDNGWGRLIAIPIVADVPEGQDAHFVNRYEASLDYAAAGGIDLAKVLRGRDMGDGQFGVTVTAADREGCEPAAATAAKLGLTEGKLSYDVAIPAGLDGEEVRTPLLPVGLAFTQADAGKTFAFTVAETKKGGAGYTNDERVYTVSISVADSGRGFLTATTRVDDGVGNVQQWEYRSDAPTAPAAATAAATDRPQVRFENRYDAAGMLDVRVRKELAGRPLAAGEFSFVMELVGGRGAAPIELGRASAAADGSVAFEAVRVDVAQLSAWEREGYATADQNGWRLHVRVAEDTSSLPDGVSASVASVDAAVQVADRGDGTLAVDVAWGDAGSTLTNIYATDGPVSVTPTGSKVLDHAAGLAPDSIAGKFSFDLEAVTPDAPMPKGDGAHAVNDEAGNVRFGRIVFDASLLDDVAPDADGARERVFEYTVTERGSAPGVQNDPDGVRMFAYTLRDDGHGHLSVSSDSEPVLFTFVNSYAASPASVELEASKRLDGRPLRAGEFTFDLYSQTGELVGSAACASDGAVRFDALTFAEPGAYAYRMVERAGDLPGVTYDEHAFDVRILVEDAGDGRLIASVSYEGGSAPEFVNAYEPVPAAFVPVAHKALEHGELHEGQFEFELLDDRGNVVQKVANAADGTVAFAPVTLDASVFADTPWSDGAEGPERRTSVSLAVREVVPADAVNPQGVRYADASAEQRAAGGFKKEGVTYDASVRVVRVSLVDRANGSIEVESVTWDAGPTFVNRADLPAPPVPSDPYPPAMPGPGAPMPGPGDPRPESDKGAHGGDTPLPATGDPVAPMAVLIVALLGAGLMAMAHRLRRDRS